MKKNAPERISSGIDELVDRLKNDGIQAGQQQALDIVAEAEKRADLMLKQAKEKSAALLKESHEQIEREQQAAQDALQLAFRDMVLDMKNAMLERLSQDFSREISQQAASVPLLEKIILESVRLISSDVRVKADKGVTEAEVLIPQQMMQLDDIRANPEKASEGPLTDLAAHLSAQMFSEGISFAAGEQQAGIVMKLKGHDMQVDISDKAIADLLLKYLQPRFRALLEGVIH